MKKILSSLLFLLFISVVSAQNLELIALTKEDVKLKYKPELYSLVKLTIPKNTEVSIKDIAENSKYLEVCLEDRCGYLHKNELVFSEEVRKWYDTSLTERKQKEKQQWEKEYAKRLADYKAREDSLKKKYGEKEYQMMKNGEIWIGMTSEQCRESIGNPSKINRDVTANIIYSQWVYSSLDMYLYFENDILKSWQD